MAQKIGEHIHEDGRHCDRLVTPTGPEWFHRVGSAELESVGVTAQPYTAICDREHPEEGKAGHPFEAPEDPTWGDYCWHVGDDGRCGWRAADHVGMPLSMRGIPHPALDEIDADEKPED